MDGWTDRQSEGLAHTLPGLQVFGHIRGNVASAEVKGASPSCSPGSAACAASEQRGQLVCVRNSWPGISPSAS